MAEEMRLFNTLSRTVEDFRPLIPGQVGMYSCGPTVYSFAHIGNMRAYIFADLLRRNFELLGYQVRHVMNITDVGHLTDDGDEGEDKLEVGSRREGLDAWAVARKYTDAFFVDTALLGIRRPDVVCKATDYIPEQIAMIATLLRQGYAYATPDGVYFDTSRFPDYPKLGRLDVAGLQEGHRIDAREKRHKTDFALWKFSPANEHRCMEWDAPWGRGFPGWHIECSAMAIKFLGEQFDVHTGGVDHIPIHHTNEIAQSECATGKSPFVRYWLHGEFLVIDESIKMSKSAGAVLTVTSLVEQGFEPLAFRLLVLQTHYRKQLKFSLEILTGAQRGYERLTQLAQRTATAAQLSLAAARADASLLAEPLAAAGAAYQTSLHAALANDLGTPAALATLYSLLDDQAVPPRQRLRLLLELDSVLGLDLLREPRSDCIPAELNELLAQRNAARAAKQWAEADRLRQELLGKGYEIHDSPGGSELKRKI